MANFELVTRVTTNGYKTYTIYGRLSDGSLATTGVSFGAQYEEGNPELAKLTVAALNGLSDEDAARYMHEVGRPMPNSYDY